MKAKLALQDGTVYTGESFGATGERIGEAVFNTSLTGYQEILTDPSYRGQTVVMTYPLIGNCGVNDEDVESLSGPQVEGFVVRQLSRIVSNFRATCSLDEYLARHGVVGLQGVDTRAIVRRIRMEGAMMSVISSEDLDDESLVRKARSAPPMLGRDLVPAVTTSEPYDWDEAFCWRFAPSAPPPPARFFVVTIDYGVKLSMLRNLRAAGCKVRVVPSTTLADEILQMKPDGVFLSNGPGDPAAVSYGIECVRGLLGRVPIFGICLGHQIIGLALGGRTFKLKFGHRGGNHPVKDLRTGRVEITTQNHSFAVDPDSLDSSCVEITHINLNDQTVEGLRHRSLPVFSVQYHPEASPGPHDATHMFRKFAEVLAEHKGH